ncbi:hypothetical protein E3Q22_03424 [Wallemia mellicola]|uniref:Uridylate kinase n=2 Tax=Wallemia mellicola TaxID=1708541 RepID=A0A4T0TBT0_9BASI|nr:substrate specificity and assembly of catalytic center derived from Two structures of ligated uridylate kinase [Wallemia mellicola CBS 633.66]TIB68800.1 hypothetical protein E3Q24_03539 [Wallemia mellicola]EIM22526.1 substrate specificity and assembly of catalytic center derived from Two structures of ligated uridylate kinase [Wallemia mellicola CBS 633.66]TIB72855.1 hypothetical protein E3Q23_03239 [Wallemia mellicola]TIB76678.1 hypothetical protein E3Q22_03424 [Wallemia mellicola]TIB82577|eukprot:XP_006957198.1 substrate specificity and assembly of catalytic center derived from Two structures of ligated uridylate kinase [Wallemia mellicola CBS 633.66]
MFNDKEVTVIFVLGGPGAGKGTQCEKLVADFNFCHLSAGDLLRAEQQREGSKEGELIRNYIKEGKIVPSYVTLKLLENAMNESINVNKNSRFLIDGFPRQMDQAEAFDAQVCNSKFALFLDCPEKTMEDRLAIRSKTSGREDDNIESIRKRFKTFIQTSMPVIEYYKSLGKCIQVDCTPAIDEVYQTIKAIVHEKIV